MFSLGRKIGSLFSSGKEVKRGYTLGKAVYDKTISGKPYIELTHVEATGIQFMDSGITNDGDLKVVDNVFIKDTYVKEFMFFGGRRTTSQGLGLYYNDYKSVLQAYGGGFSGFSIYPYLYNKWSELTLDKTGMTIDGKFYARTGIEIPEINNAPIYIDALYSVSGADARKYKGLKGRFQIYKDGVLVFDAIPCKLKETGEVGRWDLISDKFFGNIGEGNYVGGYEIAEQIL